MSSLACGVDFGTTNSSVALVKDGDPIVVSLDDANDSPTSLPSLIYIARDGETIIGRKAADAFIERNVGREVITEKVDLDIDIEGYVGSELDKEDGYRPPEDGAPTEAVRARALVEVNSPGRLFQSIKTSLKLKEFRGTQVFGENYLIEELTAMILRPMKEKLEAQTGQVVERAVFGRPVRFSKRPDEDKTAERRLRTAADLAGFKDVTFFYEPVAACIEYAIATEKQQRLMVVDIGGGTCDVCIMEFGGGDQTAHRLAQSKILGVKGVPIAGDAVDRQVIREKLYPCFGSNARYGPAQLPMPQNTMRAVIDWQSLYKLNTEDTINWLIAAEASSTQPEALRALRCLIQRNYGYPVTRTVEMAKKLLSSQSEAPISIHEYDIHIDEILKQEEFGAVIDDVLYDMLKPLIETEEEAGLKPSDIDLVLTTGGTSLIPAVRQKLEERYGKEKLIQRDTFTSVATGLAIVAQHS